MICAPIDTEAPRFVVLTIEGYPIYPSGRTRGGRKPMLSVTVLDRFYQREMRTLRSIDPRPAQPRKPRIATGETCPECGGPKHRHSLLCRSCARLAGSFSDNRTLGHAGALAAAAAYCAELNAWHEREGWGE